MAGWLPDNPKCHGFWFARVRHSESTKGEFGWAGFAACALYVYTNHSPTPGNVRVDLFGPTDTTKARPTLTLWGRPQWIYQRMVARMNAQ